MRIRLTKDFNTFYEIMRCLKQPFYKAKDHNFFLCRILFWYIDNAKKELIY